MIKPQDGPQTAALACEADELLYGGGVFGGKTWELVIDVLGLQFEQSPLGRKAIDFRDYRGVLFRRKTTEFTKLIEESRKHYGDYGGYFIYGRRGDPGPSWTFPSGARIFICHLESEDNKFDHDSMEYQFIGFDQLEQFTLTQYLHMLGRGRTMISGLFVRYRSTANPIGVGLKWVKARFVKNAEPYAIRYMKAADEPKQNPAGFDVTERVLTGKMSDEEMKDVVSRVYIPANYKDNPLGLERDPGYPGRVKAQGKKHERALLFNDWDAFSGDFFSDFNPLPASAGGMLQTPFTIPKEWQLVGSLDPGWTSACSFSLRAVDLKWNVYRLATYYVENTSMPQNVKGIMSFVRSFKWTGGRIPETVVAGHDAWARHDKWAIMGEELTFADLFQAEGIVLQKAVTDRINGWGVVNTLMAEKRWFVFDGLNDAFIEEVLAAEHDELDVNDIMGRGNNPEVSDHALDEERYGDMAVYRPRQKPRSEIGGRRSDYGVRGQRSEGRGQKKKGWLPGQR